MMPQLLQQMQNPAVQQLMANPEALQAIMQIQQGMERLRVASPELFTTLGLPSLPPGLIPPGMASAAAATATTTAATSNPASPATTTTTTASPAPSTAATSQPNQQDMFSQFMSQMVNQMSS